MDHVTCFVTNTCICFRATSWG